MRLILLFILFNCFFKRVKKGKFDKALVIVDKIEKVNGFENMLSALMKVPVYYALDNLNAFYSVSSRSFIYIHNNEKLNQHEKKYLSNYIFKLFSLENSERETQFDDGFDYQMINSLYLKHFPYKKYNSK